MKFKILILAFSLPVCGMSRLSRVATSLSTTALAGCAAQLVANYVQQQQEKSLISLPDASEKTKTFVKDRTGLDNILVKRFSYNGNIAAAAHVENSDFILISPVMEDEIIEGKNIDTNTAIIQHEAGHIKDKFSQKQYRNMISSALIQTHILSMAASTIIPTPKSIPLFVAKYILSTISKIALMIISIESPYLIYNKHVRMINPVFLIKQKTLRDGELRADGYIELQFVPGAIKSLERLLKTDGDVHHIFPDKEERKIVKLLQTHPSLKKRIRLHEERLAKSKENVVS